MQFSHSPKPEASRSTRDRHLESLLRVLVGHPSARKKLARATGISFTSITRLASLLLSLDVVAELPPISHVAAGRGRPEVPLTVTHDTGKVIIGVHLNLGRISAGAFTLDGQQLADEAVEFTSNDAREALRLAELVAGRLVAGLAPGRVLGVGFSLPGAVDHDSGRVLRTSLFHPRDLDLCTPLSSALGLPVQIDSKVRSLIFRRLWWGPAPADSFAILHIGDTIAAAMAIDGQLYRGPGATAGEISHVRVPQGPGLDCPCGRVDCAGVALTSSAIIQEAKLRGALAPDATSADLDSQDPSPQIRDLFRQRAEGLGELVGTLMEIVDPETIVVAGDVGLAEDIDTCRQAARRRCAETLPAAPRPIEFWRVRDSDWTGAAAALVLDDFVRRPTSYLPGLDADIY
ncbi:MAG: ROK family protein [Arachnia sp.]